MKPIALVGYMGSGKTYWGKLLAEALEMRFVDLDAILEEHYLGTTISTFMAHKGELAFRKIERQALAEMTSNLHPMVLATGGGTPCYFDNMALLNQSFVTLYLDVKISTLYNRLAEGGSERPLLAHLNENDLKEFIAKHLFERRPFYHQSKLIVKADDISLKTMLNTIMNYGE